MKIQTKLVASFLMIGSVSLAQATTYNVSAVFSDGGVQRQTTFDGTFDWDGSVVSNFTGLLSESMWKWNENINDFGFGTGVYGDKVYAKPGGYIQDDAPLLHLTNQVASTISNGYVTASVFLNDDGLGNADTNMYAGGGYNTGDSIKTGASGFYNDGNVANENAYFTLVFDELNPTNTTMTMSQMVYGDCSALGLMGGLLTGALCMTGHTFETLGYAGSMGGMPLSLSVAAVPVPGAALLFGSALISVFTGSRRKITLSA